MKYFNIAVIFVLLIIPGFLEAQQNSNNIDIQIDVSEPSAADITGNDVFETDSLNFKPLSLNEVIQIALLHNRILERNRSLEKTAKINLEQAQYRYLPSANFSGSSGENSSVSLGTVEKTKTVSSYFGFSRALETGGSVSVGIKNGTSESSANAGVVNYNSGISVSLWHPLLRGRGIEINQVPIKNAKNYANVSLLSVKQNMINLITTIESQYWDLILVYEDYEIQKQALQRAKELLEINKSLIESGRMASQEIVQTESDIASREMSVAGVENTIISRQITLQSQLDTGENFYIKPTTKMEFQPIEIDLSNCLEKAYNNRPDWLIHQLYLDIHRMNLVVAKNSTKYSLNGSFSFGSDVTSDEAMQNAMKDAFAFKELGWNVGLSFAVPFNKKVLENNYQLYKLSFERQELFVEELEDNIRIAVENAVRNVKYTLRQVSMAKHAKELAKKKLILEEDKMRVGRSSNFQVISYQRDLTTAQNSELVAIAGYLKAIGRLEAVMGTTLIKWNIDLDVN